MIQTKGNEGIGLNNSYMDSFFNPNLARLEAAENVIITSERYLIRTIAK